MDMEITAAVTAVVMEIIMRQHLPFFRNQTYFCGAVWGPLFWRRFLDGYAAPM